MDNTKEKTNDISFKESIKNLEKEFGEGSVISFSKNNLKTMKVIPTGSVQIDEILGIKGYPYGRVIEVFGPESSAKTTLALHAIAECQKQGNVAAFIDVEHALDPSYAEKLGVNLEKVIFFQPNSGEQALGIVEAIARNNAASLIVVDSVAALAPQAELEGEMEDITIGAQARLMSKALRRLTALISRKNIVVFFVNQVRDKIGVFFGNKETTPGGRALKFYSSLRIELRRIKQITRNGNNVGSIVRVKVVKNKMAPPFRVANIQVIFSQGIIKELEIIEMAVTKKIIVKKGSWYTYKDKQLGQGQQGCLEFLKKHPELLKEIQMSLS